MIELIIVFLILCAFVIFEWMREIHTFRMTHYQISSKKLKGLKTGRKVVLISDFHSYVYGKNNEKLITAIAQEQPDLILVAGDMLVARKGENPGIAEAFLEKISEICDVYMANGNHEQKIKEELETYQDTYARFRQSMDAFGIRVLENERVDLNWDGIPVEVIGLEIPREKYTKFSKQTYDLPLMREQVGEAEQSKYEILIAHNPNFAETYLEWGADLIVSGHLHGGVVRLPKIGGVITPNFSLFPKYSGEMTKVGDASVVVSKGIGLHTIKVRLFNPAEIVVMHVGSTEE